MDFQNLWQELAELKQARKSAAVVLVFGVVFGWTVANVLYGERMALMERQVEALQSPTTAAVANVRWRPSVWTVSVLVVSGSALVAVLVFLFWKRRDKQQLAVNEPAVAIYEHSSSTDPSLPARLGSLFQLGGWSVGFARTDVPRHARGVWVHGGTPQERASAKWALQTLGVTPEIDHHDDKPPTLQIIVGRTEQQPPTAPAKSGPPIKWVSVEEQRAAAAAERPTAKSPIADGELEYMEKRDKQGNLYLKVRNLKEEPKTRYALSIIDLRVWSERLGSSGGFAQFPEWLSHGRPIICIESGGRRGYLDHVEPKLFEVIRNPGHGPWHVRGTSEEHITLKDGVWRFDLEFSWGVGIAVSSHVVRLASVKGANKTAEFVSASTP